jgi:hypothetical protein
MTQATLWGDSGPATGQTPQSNPLLAVYGPGPDGATCRTCVHLMRLAHHDRTYRKCALRSVTHGAATDHRAGWPACGRFSPAGRR